MLLVDNVDNFTISVQGIYWENREKDFTLEFC